MNNVALKNPFQDSINKISHTIFKRELLAVYCRAHEYIVMIHWGRKYEDSTFCYLKCSPKSGRNIFKRR